jgi:hypothetical protein
MPISVLLVVCLVVVLVDTTWSLASCKKSRQITVSEESSESLEFYIGKMRQAGKSENEINKKIY